MEPVERSVQVPWGNRDRVFPDRTYCGRIVYDRPRHPFLLSDVERIISKIQPPSVTGVKPDVGRLERVFRALWALSMGTAIPFPGDFQGKILDYIVWAFQNSWEVISDPWGALKSRTFELIISLMILFNLGEEIRLYYGWK